MEQLPSLSPTEAYFVSRATEALPIEEAEIYRGDRDELVLFWDAPCKAVGGLWLCVRDGQEIRLSSQLSHTHLERWRIEGEVDAEDDLWLRLVDRGIAEAREILNGETFFIKSYDGEGNEEPSSAMWPRRRWIEKQSAGTGKRKRAWNWFGEVTAD